MPISVTSGTTSQSHSVLQAAKEITRSNGPEPASAAFVLASSGHLYPVTSVLTSMPAVDICILRMASEPIRRNGRSSPSPHSPSSSTSSPSNAVPFLKSMPVSAFPALVGTRVASLNYNDPSTPPTPSSPRWSMGRVCEYSDLAGRLAETGTYDDLSAMHTSTIPQAGSSGGPIIDVETGAVVGVIRGSSMRYGDKGFRGLSAPAEKIFEVCILKVWDQSPKRLAKAEYPLPFRSSSNYQASLARTRRHSGRSLKFKRTTRRRKESLDRAR